MVKSHEKSRFSLYSLSNIRNASCCILQIEDTQTKFDTGEKCYLCEVLDSCYVNRNPNVPQLTEELVRLNKENRTLRNRVDRLQKQLTGIKL